MLCKKCRTAISDNDIACGFCGHQTPRRRKSKIVFAGLMSTLVMILCGGYIYFDANGMLPKPDDGDEYTQETQIPDTSYNNDEYYTINSITDTRKPQNLTNSEVVESTLDGGDLDEIWLILENVEKALLQYRYLNSVNTNFISKNGYFYNYDNEAFVSIGDLISAELLPEIYAKENVLLLYLAPSDFSRFKEVDFGVSSDLRIFAGYETKDGIALYSDGQRGLIYRENFNLILTYYALTNTEIYEPLSESSEFIGIENAIKSFEFDGEGYDIRYVRVDGEYAVMVLSRKSDSTTLHGYLLARIGSDFKVILSEFEQYDGYIAEINNAAKNFNFDLLPDPLPDMYTLYGETRYKNILNELINREEIEQDDFVTFINGTNLFLYIEYNSGKKYLGQLDTEKGSWKLNSFKTRTEARAKLESLTDEPPSMIILTE